MKTFFMLLALLLSIVVMTQPVKEKTVIIITKTKPYCGGANPPEEILNEAGKKKIPFGEKFYIIKGGCNTKNRKIIKTMQFDSTGSYMVMLDPGCYSVINNFGFETLRADSNYYDMNCLNELWKKPLFSFTVIKGKSETFSHNIAEPCQYNMPCVKNKIGIPM